ncbi:MAG: hypothetical protein ACR2IH_09890 [Pyrinomonadaceae bacterium]
MKNIQKTLTALTLMTVLAFGTTFANAGIIVAGATSGDPCTDTTKVDNGIIVAGLTGIIVAGFTGIIVAGFSSDTKDPVNCGIIVAG